MQQSCYLIFPDIPDRDVVSLSFGGPNRDRVFVLTLKNLYLVTGKVLLG